MRNFKLMVLGAMLLSGCQYGSPIQPVKYEPRIGINTTPLQVDQAMQIRDWDRSVSMYSSGNTIAGPTGFLYELSWNYPGWSYPLLETPLFIGQAFALPVTLALAPPWERVRYTGDWVGPTSTAMPPLPPLPVAAPENPPPPQAARPAHHWHFLWFGNHSTT
jgi:hypothetical protein